MFSSSKPDGRVVELPRLAKFDGSKWRKSTLKKEREITIKKNLKGSRNEPFKSHIRNPTRKMNYMWQNLTITDLKN